MNLLKCVLSVILLLLYVRPNSATDVMSCTESRESNEECGTFCYKVVKQLFQYLRISAENNDQYEKLQQRETTIKSLESKANANKEALSNCSEDKLKAEKETLKLQATIHEQQLIIKELEYKELLTNHTKQREQTNLEAQQEALRKSNELISEKDKRIVDLDKELEARDEAQKETLKETQQLQAKVKELQTKIKESDKLKDSLISEKDKRIAQIEEQLSSMEHENKLLKDELTKQKDRAEATSCLPFGNSSDTQTLRLPGVNAFRVPCDSKFAGPGWVVIQRRVDGSVNFNRTWEEYKNGFGDLRGNFWLGLEKLHLMTKLRPQELYIQLEDFKNETRYARYTNFTIGSEAQYYELISVGNYTGNAGDALNYTEVNYTHINMKFSTPDRDNDKFDGNCARYYQSGWWFNNCHYCNLNAKYMSTNTDEESVDYIEWMTWHSKPLKFVQMMIRPTKK